jgi:hypothetical protein
LLRTGYLAEQNTYMGRMKIEKAYQKWVGRSTDTGLGPLRMFTPMNNLLSVNSGGNYSLLTKAGILTSVGPRRSNGT